MRGRWTWDVGRMSESVPGCDAPTATRMTLSDGSVVCRCVLCARCGRHTGNANQGHYGSWCRKTMRFEGFHFCCPDDCDLENPYG